MICYTYKCIQLWYICTGTYNSLEWTATWTCFGSLFNLLFRHNSFYNEIHEYVQMDEKTIYEWARRYWSTIADRISCWKRRDQSISQWPKIFNININFLRFSYRSAEIRQTNYKVVTVNYKVVVTVFNSILVFKDHFKFNKLLKGW